MKWAKALLKRRLPGRCCYWYVFCGHSSRVIPYSPRHQEEGQMNQHEKGPDLKNISSSYILPLRSGPFSLTLTQLVLFIVSMVHLLQSVETLWEPVSSRKVYLIYLSLTPRKANSLCGRQLDRHEQSKEDGPGTEGCQGRKPWAPSNRQNWKNKVLAPRVTFSPLEYHCHEV